MFGLRVVGIGIMPGKGMCGEKVIGSGLREHRFGQPAIGVRQGEVGYGFRAIGGGVNPPNSGKPG